MKTKIACLMGAMAFAIGIVTLLLATLSASATSSVTSSTVTWTDDFDSPSLNSRWLWIREDATHWSLTARPGFLRITTQKGGLYGTTTNNGKNLLVQDVPVGNFEIQTRVIFTPTTNFHTAGLLVYQNDDNYLALIRTYCGFVPPCVGNGIYFDHEEQGQIIGGNFAMTTTVPGEAYLRLVRHSTVYTGYASMNGTDWALVGTHTVISGLIPSKIGLVAYDSDTGAPEIPADFDFFQLNDNSYRVFLPVVMRQ